MFINILQFYTGMNGCFKLTQKTHEMQSISINFINDKLRNFYIIIYIVSINRVMRANRQNITVREKEDFQFCSVLTINFQF